MRRLVALLTIVVLGAASLASAQAKKPAPPPRRTTTPPSAPSITAAPDLNCPTPLGIGVTSKVAFCDVMSGRNPADGVIITLPPHRGPVTLTFDLHNRHTYSEDLIKANRAYTRYTAIIGVLTMDNTLVSRAAVQSEFRTAMDLVDRIGGGAGPAGLKAVAPAGTEHISVTIPQEEDSVSLLGEKLTVSRADGTATYTSPGRPIAVISNVMIAYVPPPPPKAPVRRPVTK